METLNAIMTRRSIRALKTDPIPKEKLDLLVQAGSQAASAGNRQPWAFITISDPKRVKALKSLSPGILCNPQAIIVICMNVSLAMHTGDGQVDKMTWMDIGAAMQNILLAAHDLGLGACPIGSFNQEAVARLLQLPDEVESALFITIGIPERIPEAPRKRLLQEITFSEKYGGLRE